MYEIKQKEKREKRRRRLAFWWCCCAGLITLLLITAISVTVPLVVVVNRFIPPLNTTTTAPITTTTPPITTIATTTPVPLPNCLTDILYILDNNTTNTKLFSYNVNDYNFTQIGNGLGTDMDYIITGPDNQIYGIRNDNESFPILNGFSLFSINTVTSVPTLLCSTPFIISGLVEYVFGFDESFNLWLRDDFPQNSVYIVNPLTCDLTLIINTTGHCNSGGTMGNTLYCVIVSIPDINNRVDTVDLIPPYTETNIGTTMVDLLGAKPQQLFPFCPASRYPNMYLEFFYQATTLLNPVLAPMMFYAVNMLNGNMFRNNLTLAESLTFNQTMRGPTMACWCNISFGVFPTN